jgi:hypothetical protein
MSSRDVETLIEKVRALPLDKLEEVISFVESIARPEQQPAKTIWEEIRDITRDVPDEVWERLPRDGAEQHDHYLYGAPKK